MGPRYRRRPLPAAVTLVLLILLIASRWWRDGQQPRTIEQPGVATQADLPAIRPKVHVKRVVDGDTLLLQNGERVRLIGIDTPESVKPDTPPEPLGHEASEFTRRLVEGRDVLLEFDRHREDQYGRTLAYVYVDDVLLNEEIVRQGFSRAETRFPFRSDFQRRFVDAEQEARAARRGIWSLAP